MMSDLDFTVEEFVDYWEAKTKEDKLGKEWMTMQVQTSNGLDKLQQVGTELARRHGVSSDELKTFRTTLGEASAAAGLDPLTLKKTKVDDDVGFYMAVTHRKPHENSREVNKAHTAYRRMKKWVEKEGFDVEEIEEGCAELRTFFS